MRRGALVLGLLFLFPASASARPYLTMHRATAAVRDYGSLDARRGIRITNCRRITARRVNCVLYERGEVIAEILGVKFRQTVRWPCSVELRTHHLDKSQRREFMPALLRPEIYIHVAGTNQYPYYEPL